MRAFCLSFVGVVAIAQVSAMNAAAEDLVPYEIVDEISIPAPLTGEPGDPARGRAIMVRRQ